MLNGQISDFIGAAALLEDLPEAQRLLGDEGMPSTGSERPWKPRAPSPASGAAGHVMSRSNTTSAGTAAGAASRLCSAG